MAADDPVLDRILDLVLYAPLGLALTARDQLPRFAAEGRKRFATQARLARMVGEMAVQQGRRQVSALIGTPPAPSAGGPSGTGAAAGPAGAEQGTPVTVADVPPGRPWPDAPAAGAGGGPPPPAATDLAIPGYDSLSASQVVQRLPGLSAEELAVVRAYETAGRARKTVLTRIQQLGA